MTGLTRRRLEAEIELLVTAVAEGNGWLSRKLKWVGRHSAPDRVYMKGGRTVWVEFKREGEKPRPSQQRELARLREKGQEVYVIDDVEVGYELFES